MIRAIAHLTGLLLVGCYASHMPADDVGDDGCPRPRGFVSPIEVRDLEGDCVIEGSDELDVTWQSLCDGTSCTLSREDLAVCECTALDIASTCANGVPTCAHWRYFDFAHAE